MPEDWYQGARMWYRFVRGTCVERCVRFWCGAPPLPWYLLVFPGECTMPPSGIPVRMRQDAVAVVLW